MFGIFKKENRGSSSDGEILSVKDIEALVKRIGPEQAVEIIREKAISGHKLCQSFMSTSAIHFLDNTKLSPVAKARAQKDAEQFTRLAAENGDMEAQFNLSLMLQRKVDISGDYITEQHIEHIREGKMWADKSAAQGFKPAFDLLKSFEVLKRFL